MPSLPVWAWQRQTFDLLLVRAFQSRWVGLECLSIVRIRLGSSLVVRLSLCSSALRITAPPSLRQMYRSVLPASYLGHLARGTFSF